MATTVSKIRLGACDTMTLLGVDLGSSIGGAELTYNPTNFLVEIDQAIMPVQAFKTKEEISFGVALAQYQMSLVAAVFSYAQTGVTTVAGTPSTDTLYFGGTVNLQEGTFDWSCPKNDGTVNKIRGHFNNCFAYKQGKFDFKRDKSTEIQKCELLALADLTKVQGQQAGWLREEY